MLVLTPNRRAGRELALALYRRLGRAFIAPSIRPLGDAADQDDASLAFGPDALDLPPAYPPAKRRGALARLIQTWRTARKEEPLPPASALAAADEFAALLDQAAIAGDVDWSQLGPVADELTPNQAGHWKLSADFLSIVTAAWPKHLAEQDAVDLQQRRLIAARALAQRWDKSPPKHPVIIAGSTGAGAASRALMQAVLKLPLGLVVLPGLDPDLDAAGWAAIAEAPSHPQFVLRETLAALGSAPGDVAPWPASFEAGISESSAQRARRRLVNEALAPAKSTRGWNKRLIRLADPGSAEDLVRSALAGLSLIEAEDEAEEALAAALLLRETLERPGATAALVTPEASLGRRVAAIMERWGVDIAPSAGAPLTRVAPGTLLLILSRWALDPSHPVTLLSLLKHPLAGLGRAPDVLARMTSELERRALRGARRDFSLATLALRLDAMDAPQLAGLIRDLDARLAPHAHTFAGDALDGQAACEALARLATSIATTPDEADGARRMWSGQPGAAALTFLEDLAALCSTFGPVAASDFPDLAEAAAARTLAQPDAPEHPRIAIWGPLEARLQHRDRMILAGLNEGAWPKPAAADAFLNRSLRTRLGLPDPDERLGLSAHDFAQMANAPEVVLLRARRVDDKPAVASRWLWRLRTLSAGGLNGDGMGDSAAAEAALRPPPALDALAWARALRRPGAVTPVTQPSPRPPVAARALKKFSPSRVARLIRDPYADYARYILRLEALRSVGEDIDARERGTAVHAAIEAHERHGGDLGDLIVAKLLEAGASPELVELERPLWLRAAGVYRDWAAARAPNVAAFALEQKGETTISTLAGDVLLGAKADRIERLTDGTLAVIDFKTGKPPTGPQVASGIEPQLALEALIAARAPFGGIGPAPTSELIYVQMATSAAVMRANNGRPLALVAKDKTPLSTDDVIASTLAGFVRLVETYGDPAQPYLSRPRVLRANDEGDYDRLARRAEWTVEEGEE